MNLQELIILLVILLSAGRLLCSTLAGKTLPSRITVAICVVGDNRRLLSGGTGFIAISDILFSLSFHLGGATVVIFSIDWHTSFYLRHIYKRF